MALTVRRLPNALTFALASAFNSFIRKFVELETTFAHYDVTSDAGGDYQTPTSTTLGVVASSTATLGAVIIMAEEMRTVLLRHFTDAVAHGESDATNEALITVATVPTATTQGTVNTLLNALSTAFTAHESETDVHPHDDATNLITAPAATNLATSQTLAADIRTQIIARE